MLDITTETLDMSVKSTQFANRFVMEHKRSKAIKPDLKVFACELKRGGRRTGSCLGGEN